MICKTCNFENEEGSLFCASCGSPLAADEATDAVTDAETTDNVAETDVKTEENSDGEADEAVQDDDRTVLVDVEIPGKYSTEEPSMVESEEKSNPEEVDDSEANTSVLTSDMNMGTPVPVPQGFNSVPNAMAGSVPMNGQPPMGPGFGNPMGMSGGQIPITGQPPMGGPAPKPGKAPKAPKQMKSGKAGTGTKAYIAISIILMLAMAGGMVFGYLHFSGKLDDVDKEKETLESSHASVVATYESEVSELEKEISTLEADITTYKSDITDYQSQIASYEESNDAYAAYDALIGFVGKCNGQGYADFMCSDSVIHLTGDQAEIKVFLLSEEGKVGYSCDNKNVVACEWAEDWEGDVITLKLNRVGSGNAVITLYNDFNDEEMKVFVYVD